MSGGDEAVVVAVEAISGSEVPSSHSRPASTPGGPPGLLMRLRENGVKEVFALGKDGKPVDGTLTEQGTIKSGGGKGVAPLTFLRSVLPKSPSTHTWKDHLNVTVDGEDMSLTQYILQNPQVNTPIDPDTDGKVAQAMTKFLSERTIETVEDLYTAIHGATPKHPRFLYRVLRLEDEAPSVEAHGLKPRDPIQTNLVQLGKEIYNHVTHGTGTGKDHGFLSTTSDPAVAAWWSHSFLCPVARIDTSKCPSVPVWDPSAFTALSKVNAQFKWFARKSAEFLLQGDVPSGAVVIWRPHIDARLVASFGGVAVDDVRTLVPNKNLNGWTEPTEFTDPATDKKYVLKQGRGGQMKGIPLLCASVSHCAAEFMALKIYHAAGAFVPGAALFNLRLRGDDADADEAPFHLITAVLVAEKIDGVPLDPKSHGEAAANAKEMAWLDLALANFDVCGIGYSNLVKTAGEKVYRVDAGCNVLFSAQGAHSKSLVPLSADELNAFQTAPKSARSKDLTSAKAVSVDGYDKSITSGEARVRLLGPAINNLDVSTLEQEIRDLQQKLHVWLWEQGLPLSQWVDMVDIVIARACEIQHVITPPPAVPGTLEFYSDDEIGIADDEVDIIDDGT